METKINLEMCCYTCLYSEDSKWKVSPCDQCRNERKEGNEDTYYLRWKPKEGEKCYNLKTVQSFILKKKEEDKTYIIKTCDSIVKDLLEYLENDPKIIKAYVYTISATFSLAIVDELIHRGFKVICSDPIPTLSLEDKQGGDNIKLTISGW